MSCLTKCQVQASWSSSHRPKAHARRGPPQNTASWDYPKRIPNYILTSQLSHVISLSVRVHDATHKEISKLTDTFHYFRCCDHHIANTHFWNRFSAVLGHRCPLKSSKRNRMMSLTSRTSLTGSMNAGATGPFWNCYCFFHWNLPLKISKNCIKLLPGRFDLRKYC